MGLVYFRAVWGHVFARVRGRSYARRRWVHSRVLRVREEAEGAGLGAGEAGAMSPVRGGRFDGPPQTAGRRDGNGPATRAGTSSARGSAPAGGRPVFGRTRIR